MTKTEIKIYEKLEELKKIAGIAHRRGGELTAANGALYWLTLDREITRYGVINSLTNDDKVTARIFEEIVEVIIKSDSDAQEMIQEIREYLTAETAAADAKSAAARRDMKLLLELL